MLMISFVDAFFRTGGEQFGFLVYDELIRGVYAGDLNYVLANCIAAWATRWVSPISGDHPVSFMWDPGTRKYQDSATSIRCLFQHSTCPAPR